MGETRSLTVKYPFVFALAIASQTHRFPSPLKMACVLDIDQIIITVDNKVFTELCCSHLLSGEKLAGRDADEVTLARTAGRDVLTTLQATLKNKSVSPSTLFMAVGGLCDHPKTMERWVQDEYCLNLYKAGSSQTLRTQGGTSAILALASCAQPAAKPVPKAGRKKDSKEDAAPVRC